MGTRPSAQGCINNGGPEARSPPPFLPSPSPLSCRIPLYYEAKVLTVLFLWHPKSRGALYLYDTMFKPWLDSNQRTIDEKITEVQDWVAGHITNHYNQ